MKTGSKILIVLLSIIAFLLVIVTFLFIRYDGPTLIKKVMSVEEETTTPAVERVEDVIEVIDDLDSYEVENINDLRSDGSLSSTLKNWATSTTDLQLMKSQDVINFLLVGVDGGGTNADVIMLCSVNTSTKKIYLTSVMRDSYTYINGDGNDVYFKINSSYYYGGVQNLIDTFQNDFKIKINHYVTVNFSSFAEIVDIMGGINLDITQSEANEIDKVIANENKQEYDDCPVGDGVLLDGIHALTFCRIRHCYIDADVHRTQNQRTFVTALIEKFKDTSIDQATNVISTFLSYVKTDLTSSEILKFARVGITDRWYNYEIISSCYPEETERTDYSGSAWVWIVDYPAAAQKMQTLIYGESNITLSEDRVSALDIISSGRSIY